MRSTMSGGGDFRATLRRMFVQGHNPATTALVAIGAVSWFSGAILGGADPFRYLAFSTGSWPLPRLWSLFTWPLIADGFPVWALFALMWLYTVGGSLERSWGTRTFLAFFFGTNAIAALSYWVGCKLLGMEAGLAGLYIGLATPTIAWALMNRRETVMFSFVLPIPAIWLAWLEVAVVWYLCGPPILGLFALAGCAAAWYYVEHGRHGSGPLNRILSRAGRGGATRGGGNDRFRDFGNEVRGTGREKGASDKNPLDLVGRLREQEERRRRDKQLEEMFRRSGLDDEDRDRRGR